MQEERVAASILNKQSRTADRRYFSSFGGLGEVLTTPRSKNLRCYETFDTPPSVWVTRDCFEIQHHRMIATEILLRYYMDLTSLAH
jgi:hypothetical protein